MNFTMFIPQIDEVDQFGAKGQQLDDINSLYEYIDEVVLMNTDPTPEDEDDDNGTYYHIVKTNDYSFTQQIIFLKTPEFASGKRPAFPIFSARKIPSPFFEVQSPPPEA